MDLKNRKKSKATLMVSAVLACALLVGCSANTKQQNELASEQSMQVQDEEKLAAQKEETQNRTDKKLYDAFLSNEICVPNPYVEGMSLTVMDDANYETEFADAQKSYAFADVNNDDRKELIFRISSYPSSLMYILGVSDGELICYDVKETHTSQMEFGVYDYGMVWEIQNFGDFKKIIYSYTADGKPITVRSFTEADGADMSAYDGNEVMWYDWGELKNN